jgi:hypothetical protein
MTARCLLIASVLAGLLCEQARSQPTTVRGKEPDRATITRLVEALGSSKFAEREQASKELGAIGLPALPALRTAAKDSDSELAGRAQHLMDTIENSLDQLLADYRAYGLPLPPADARLVRFESGGRGIVNGKRMPPEFFLGFLVQPENKEKQAVVLAGTREVRLWRRSTVEPVDPKPDLVDGIDIRYHHDPVFESNAGLAVALQCKARGWDALAERLWAASLKHGTGHPREAFYQPANLPNRTAVRYLAWMYSANELVMAGTGRPKTAERMKALVAAEPKLDTAPARELIKSVEASLAQSTAKPGSVERLIDDLTDMCRTGLGYGDEEPRYARLAGRGFGAVPALIDHLDDRRLTRTAQLGFNNFPPRHTQVRHVVSDLLQELAGADVGRDWLGRQRGEVVDKADALAWWETARKEGEEKYLVRNVLPPGETVGWPSTLMLELIAKKYPQHLPKLYRTILADRPKIQSWPVAKAIAESVLPDNEKQQIFLDAARTDNLLHRRSALDHLRTLDPKQFATILIATLESLPRTPKEPYWTCPEGNFAHVVLTTDDPQVWKTFETVAKRSDVGLRMQFMDPMDYTYVGDRQRAQRLAFLAAFLDDVEAPDIAADPKRFDGPHARFVFEHLEVRNLAAMKIASILDLSDKPNRDWTAKQWDDLRQRVKERLKR